MGYWYNLCTPYWMRFSRVVRASDNQCRLWNCPGFDSSILRQRGIWGATDMQCWKSSTGTGEMRNDLNTRLVRARLIYSYRTLAHFWLKSFGGFLSPITKDFLSYWRHSKHYDQWLRIRDVYPGSKFFPPRIRIFSSPHPGSASKNLSILTQKMVSKFSEIWSWLFIPDPDPGSWSWLFTHSGSRGQKAPDPGSATLPRHINAFIFKPLLHSTEKNPYKFFNKII